jgi:hypothetical protein
MRKLGVLVLLLTLASPSPCGFAWSKTTEKGLFAAGLLSFGGVVRWLIHRDTARTERETAALHAEWGEPFQVHRFTRGFDRMRVEEYRRESRRAVATYRNGRLLRVEIVE